MKLTTAQKLGLLKKGYALLPGLVPKSKQDAARREINRALGRSSSYGKNGSSGDGPALWTGLAYGPAVSNLFHETPVRALVESMIGKDALDADLQRAILIRFPQEASGRESTSYHIDGFEYQGGPEARNAPLHSHTIAVAMFLSDTRAEGAGNLALIPGSHLVLENHFREHPEAVLRREMPDVALGAPWNVRARPGDVLVYHYQVAHSAFAFRNLTPDIHCVAVFWVKRVGHDARWREALSDLWLEWPGMNDVLPSRRRR